LLWPWRPSVLRQQPEIAAKPLTTDVPLPPDLQGMGLFPQYLRPLDLAGGYQSERLHLGWVLETDMLAQTHGKLAKIPFHPPDIAPLTDLALRRGYLTLSRLRDEKGEVTAIGSQVETVALDSRIWKREIEANTDWTITVPGRGVLFLSQREGGPDIATLQSIAKKQGTPWRGFRKVNHTIGPVPGRRGIVHGGTGQFNGVVGVFEELNTFTEVPAEGDLRGRADLELILLHAPRASAQPGTAADRRPPAREVKRQLEIDLARDTIYNLSGDRNDLQDTVFARTSVFMGKLRDEHGDVVGQAGASRTAPTGGQWTLLFPGEGSLYIVAESLGSVRLGLGFLGGVAGRVIGGTGVFAETTGRLEEVWPEEGTIGPVRLTLTLR
jgi:hypothetical protein